MMINFYAHTFLIISYKSVFFLLFLLLPLCFFSPCVDFNVVVLIFWMLCSILLMLFFCCKIIVFAVIDLLSKTVVQDITSVASVRLLMPLAMLCFRSSVIVVSIMNFTLKLACLYINSLRRKDLFTCIYCCSGPQERRKLILPRSVQCIIISIEKKDLCTCILLSILLMVVFCGLPGPQDKDGSARRIWILDIIFSHMRNERACALHPQE